MLLSRVFEEEGACIKWRENQDHEMGLWAKSG